MIMKKILFSVVCLMMVGMQSVKAQVAIAALHHEGNVTIYGAAQIQATVDNAVAGDTIYLREGVFGGFSVDKSIAVIGAGQTTNISTAVNVGREESVTTSGLLLSGMNMLGNLNFYYTADGVKVSKCSILGNVDLDPPTGRDGGSFSNIEIVSSYVKGEVILDPRVNSLTVINSKIGNVENSGNSHGAATFQNCNINKTYVSNSGSNHNIYINSIIRTTTYSTYQNCLLYPDSGVGTKSDCYNATFTLDDNLNCSLSDEELRSNGYLGTDGTVVGATGGPAPFSLVMPTKQVTEHNIEVDNAARRMKVTLKLGNK